MRRCPDCPHEPHPGITCGGLLADGQCFCQAPPCQHPGFTPVREFGGIGGHGKVVGYVCVDCHRPFEVDEIKRRRPSEESA